MRRSCKRKGKKGQVQSRRRVTREKRDRTFKDALEGYRMERRERRREERLMSEREGRNEGRWACAGGKMLLAVFGGRRKYLPISAQRNHHQ